MIKLAVRRNLMATTIIAGSLMATPVFAQGTTAPATAAETADEGETIVVTGSLISNPNLISSSPVSVINSEELQLRQTNTAEQILRDIPGVVPSLGQQVNNGNPGYSSVDLRGLGSKRNIVLLDSTRLVPADESGTVDLNSIPTALIDRVDVLTGGASATYGADAISGVVNFVTKRDFAGLALSSSEQINERGDGNVLRTDLTIGANFDEGRGNAVISVGYQEADPVSQGDRDISVYSISTRTGVASGSSSVAAPTSVDFGTGTGYLQPNPAGTLLIPQYATFNFNPYNVYVTPFRRYNMYAAGRYEASDTIEVYSRAMFSKNTVSTLAAPSGVFGDGLTIPGNNPYLNSTVRDQICTLNGIALGPTCNNNPAIPLPSVYRRLVEGGPRLDTYTTQFFDYKAGLRFQVTKSMGFDIYGSYGENENRRGRFGYVALSRLQQSLNANNTTTCTVTTNNCVPTNLFGPAGSIAPNQVSFLTGAVSTTTRKTSLAQAHAVLSGDFGLTSPLASNPVSFAAGAEYRKYSADVEPDSLAQISGELGGAGSATKPLSGGYDVYEAFGELIVPLASDRPGLDLLQADGGIRYSRYKIFAAGSPEFSATTWKAGLQYAPIKAIKFRGDYQHSVRAPNINELFTPVNTTLTNLQVDPCAGAAPVSNADLKAICIAQGAPAATIGTIPQPNAGQIQSTGGGNPALKPETANSYTIGAVIDAKDYVGGLTISVDYYNIKVSGAITTPTPGDAINACFGTITAASASSVACTSTRRNPVNGGLSGSPANTPGLFLALTNQGKIATDGIDLSVNYKRDLGFAGLAISFNGNWTNHARFQASPSSIFRDCVGYFSVNCGSLQPKYSWNQRTTFSFKDIDLSLLWRHIDAMRYEGSADDFAARGFTTASRTIFSGTVTGPSPLAGGTYNFNRIPSFDYFDLATRFKITKALELTLTAFNLFDRKAPLEGSTAGATAYNNGNTFPSTYDVLGRRYGAQLNLRF